MEETDLKKLFYYIGDIKGNILLVKSCSLLFCVSRLDYVIKLMHAELHFWFEKYCRERMLNSFTAAVHNLQLLRGANPNELQCHDRLRC
jgi:hypothetical protein